jgi:hypothetical protein
VKKKGREFVEDFVGDRLITVRGDVNESEVDRAVRGVDDDGVDLGIGVGVREGESAVTKRQRVVYIEQKTTTFSFDTRFRREVGRRVVGQGRSSFEL